MDDIADGGDTVGVRWHVENDGEPLPFTRGASIYNARRQRPPQTAAVSSTCRNRRRSNFGGRRFGIASRWPRRSSTSRYPRCCESIQRQPSAATCDRCATARFPSSSSLRASCSRARTRWRSTARRVAEVRDAVAQPVAGRRSSAGRSRSCTGFGKSTIFNLVLAWSALFAGFAADAGRGGRPAPGIKYAPNARRHAVPHERVFPALPCDAA